MAYNPYLQYQEDPEGLGGYLQQPGMQPMYVVGSEADRWRQQLSAGQLAQQGQMAQAGSPQPQAYDSRLGMAQQQQGLQAQPGMLGGQQPQIQNGLIGGQAPQGYQYGAAAMARQSQMQDGIRGQAAPVSQAIATRAGSVATAAGTYGGGMAAAQQQAQQVGSQPQGQPGMAMASRQGPPGGSIFGSGPQIGPREGRAQRMIAAAKQARIGQQPGGAADQQQRQLLLSQRQSALNSASQGLQAFGQAQAQQQQTPAANRLSAAQLSAGRAQLDQQQTASFQTAQPSGVQARRLSADQLSSAAQLSAEPEEEKRLNPAMAAQRSLGRF